MFVPPGYHLGASISGVTKDDKEVGDVPYAYAPASDLVYMMMNGCWGKNYTASVVITRNGYQVSARCEVVRLLLLLDVFSSFLGGI